jgi:mitotic spindle assembly checkpoint protein MAD1
LIKDLEVNLHRLSESSEREKKTLKKELSYVKEDLSLSASKNNAEVCMVKLLQYLFVVAC